MLFKSVTTKTASVLFTMLFVCMSTIPQNIAFAQAVDEQTTPTVNEVVPLKLEVRDRTDLRIIGLLVPLATGLGLGLLTAGLASATDNPMIGTTGAVLTAGTVVLSAPTAIYFAGESQGYNGSYRQTLGQSVKRGLIGAAIVGAGLGAVAVIQTMNYECEAWICIRPSPSESFIYGVVLGAPVGYALAVGAGSVRGYENSLELSKKPISWRVLPTAIPVKSAQTSVVPGLVISGTY